MAAERQQNGKEPVCRICGRVGGADPIQLLCGRGKEGGLRADLRDFVRIQRGQNEREHAKLIFREFRDGKAEIVATYPAGMIGTTNENKKAAADGGKTEWGTIYPAFAKTAEEGDFKKSVRSCDYAQAYL